MVVVADGQTAVAAQVVENGFDGFEAIGHHIIGIAAALVEVAGISLKEAFPIAMFGLRPAGREFSTNGNAVNCTAMRFKRI